jgi:DNA-binding CsgD family transcriptional regulator
LTDVSAKGRLRIAIRLPDAALADRIASLLAKVEEIELVDLGEEAEAVLVSSLGSTEPETEIPLTARELEVLALLAEGASNKLIARRLGISTHTAKYHVASLLEKLDAVSRTDAVASAARLGVLNL